MRTREFEPFFSTLLEEDHPSLWAEFWAAKRRVGGNRHFIQASGLYERSSVGRINLYPLFVELVARYLGANGRAGIIVPSAISMDAYNAALFRWLLESSRIVSLLDFENAGELFPSVHRSYRFCLFTITGLTGSPQDISLCYFAHSVLELADPRRRVSLTRNDIRTFSPNTLSPPILQGVDDKEIAIRCYRRLGVFRDRHRGGAGAWKAAVQRMLSLSDDGDLFRRHEELAEEHLAVFERLYSGKTIHAFNHRFATFDGGDWRPSTEAELSDPEFAPTTEYYAMSTEITSRLAAKWPSRWLVGYRDIARATDERTSIAAIIPRVGCDTHCRNIYLGIEDPVLAGCLVANMNAFAFDYLARQKIIGTGMGAGVLEQLPVLPPSLYATSCDWSRATSMRSWVGNRMLELTFTSVDLKEFAEDCGWTGSPFLWSEERGFLLRCELDAAFFHLYLPADRSGDWCSDESESEEGRARLKASLPNPRDAISYIMGTFPIVRRKDVGKFSGDYRTMRVILEMYDAMQQAIRTGEPYRTRLDPPPADPRVAHAPRRS